MKELIIGLLGRSCWRQVQNSLYFCTMNFDRLKSLYAGGLGFLVLPLILSPLAIWFFAAIPTPSAELPETKINLALRRTAHQLLAAAGDTSSRIEPVRRKEVNVWVVQMEHSFDYDQLPKLLQESFDLHGVQGVYEVAVYSCGDGELQLGYHALDFKEHQDAACGGRLMQSGCYEIQVSFEASEHARLPIYWFWLAGLSVFLGLSFVVIRLKSRRPELLLSEVGDQALAFGNSRLDLANQTLLCDKTRHQLTYREAKLLHLFVSHPNQLLERGQILQQVWADEGVLVGRSVDVFVSRLRKLLRDDPSVRLVAVHGVGYRMEVG
jgi:hypothetical protein